MDTAELVRAAADGDQRSWDALVERFTGLLWGVARAHRLNANDAADVVQTTWLRLVEHLDRINERLVAGCQEVVERYRLPAYTVGISSKGCVVFSDTKIVDYETFMTRQNVEVTELAWLYNMNRGIFATPGREEEWTLSVTHTEEAADDYIAVFEELARDLTSSD